ncbi:MAG: hypothetical protein IKC87_01040 [Clostridia bacterium]|nr:hypothetical protein [Clostridia bacterium]
MKSTIYKIAVFPLIFAILLTMFSCSGEIDSYSATMLLRSASDNKGEISFGSFSGRVSLNVKNTYTQDTNLSVTATLEEGEASVYYRGSAQGVECHLFDISGLETFSETDVGYLTNGEDFKIIIKTPDGKSAKGGKVTVTVNEP